MMGKLPIKTWNWSTITGIKKKNISPITPVKIIYVIATANPFRIFLLSSSIRGEIKICYGHSNKKGYDSNPYKIDDIEEKGCN